MSERSTSDAIRLEDGCLHLVSHGPNKLFTQPKTMRFYYPIGNCAPVDLFARSPPSTSNSVLMLGSGDIRSVFYTLAKIAFTPHEATQTTRTTTSSSVASFSPRAYCHFLVNDISAAIVARNVLLVYMIVKHIGPINRTSVERGVSASVRLAIARLWSIAFNFGLTAEEDALLEEALGQLTDASRSDQAWYEFPLSRLVTFEGRTTLTAVREVWMMWSGLGLRKRLQDAKAIFSERKSRKLAGKITAAEMLNPLMGHSHWRQSSHGDFASTLLAHGPMLESLDLPAAAIMGLETDGARRVAFFNPTMTDVADDVTLHYGTNFFLCFFHSFIFDSASHFSLPKSDVPESGSKPSSDRAAAGRASSLPYVQCVPAAKFKTRTLAANCVQQFSLWMLGTASILCDDESDAPVSKNRFTARLTVHCGDCLALCDELAMRNQWRQTPLINSDQTRLPMPYKASYIHVSNVGDSVGLFNLLLCATPLLNAESVGAMISCDTFFSAFIGDTLDTFLAAISGNISRELFPALLGIITCGLEGRLASDLAVWPSSDVSRLLFEHLNSPRADAKLIFQRLPLSAKKSLPIRLEGEILSFLSAAVLSFCRFDIPVSFTTAGTAARLLLQAAQSMGLSNTPEGWQPLCDELALVRHLDPYVAELQDSMWSHRLHAHLVPESAGMCPMCTGLDFQQLKRHVIRVPLRESHITRRSGCYHVRLRCPSMGLSCIVTRSLPSEELLWVPIPTMVHAALVDNADSDVLVVPFDNSDQPSDLIATRLSLVHVMPMQVSFAVTYTDPQSTASVGVNLDVDVDDDAPPMRIESVLEELTHSEVVIAIGPSVDIPPAAAANKFLFASVTPYSASVTLPKAVRGERDVSVVVSFACPVNGGRPTKIQLGRTSRKMTVHFAKVPYEVEGAMLHYANARCLIAYPISRFADGPETVLLSGLQMTGEERKVMEEPQRANVHTLSPRSATKETIAGLLQTNKQYAQLVVDGESVDCVLYRHGLRYDVENDRALIDASVCVLTLPRLRDTVPYWQRCILNASADCNSIIVSPPELAFFKRLVAMQRELTTCPLKPWREHFERYFLCPLYSFELERGVGSLQSPGLAIREAHRISAYRAVQNAYARVEDVGSTAQMNGVPRSSHLVAAKSATSAAATPSRAPTTQPPAIAKRKMAGSPVDDNAAPPPAQSNAPQAAQKDGSATDANRRCGSCGTASSKKRCGACRVMYYCSAACQKAHWAAHKPICGKAGKAGSSSAD